MPLHGTFAEALLTLSLASFTKVHPEPPVLQIILSIKEKNPYILQYLFKHLKTTIVCPVSLLFGMVLSAHMFCRPCPLSFLLKAPSD